MRKRAAFRFGAILVHPLLIAIVFLVGFTCGGPTPPGGPGAVPSPPGFEGAFDAVLVLLFYGYLMTAGIFPLLLSLIAGAAVVWGKNTEYCIGAILVHPLLMAVVFLIGFNNGVPQVRGGAPTPPGFKAAFDAVGLFLFYGYLRTGGIFPLLLSLTAGAVTLIVWALATWAFRAQRKSHAEG